MNKSSDKLKISVSASKTYVQCARKYFYSYIERRPSKPQEHLHLGKFVHATLEDFHNAMMEDKDLDWAATLTEKFKAQLTTLNKDGTGLEYPLLPESKQRAHEMLVTYLGMLRKDGMPEVLSNERSFAIDLGDNIVVRGFIDRIDRDKEGGYIVRDYKTGRSKYLDEFQLLIYCLPLLEDEPDLEIFKGDYIMLGENSKHLPYTFTRTDVDRAVAKIKKIANQIRTDQTWDPKPSFLCGWCDFEDICPAIKMKKASTAASDATWSQTSKFDK